MRIIPAIDIIDGKCVRLTQGDYAQKKIYNEDPLQAAKEFEDSGLQYLHLVDLDGAKAGKVVNWKVIESIASGTNLKIDFGGGVKTEEELKSLRRAGVQQVNLGSIAVKNPGLVQRWIQEYGADFIILSADVRDEKVAIGAWLEESSIPVFDLVSSYLPHGIRYVTCTDIGTDGMLRGPNVALYKKLKSAFPTVSLIASGGVSGMRDIQALRQAGVDGVIVGKAIYEGKILLRELAGAG